jgi:threonine dehydrogenase-like Zn-dependent dehydrogenase
MSIREVDEPAPGPGQVRARVKWTGICGTDVHIASGAFFHYFPPLILGHEFFGEIDTLGEGVEGVSVGDRVTAEPAMNVPSQWTGAHR